MILDCHIHIMGNNPPGYDDLKKRMRRAKVSGGVVISPPPPSFPWLGGRFGAEKRLDVLLACTKGDGLLFPFFWIDPKEKGAKKQVDAAVLRKVKGFKVICNYFFPYDKQALSVFRCISETGRPLLFHSGILWDHMDSSRFNRPAGFEALIDVAGLRFALAHLGWPWCDEAIAVYGKFLSARRKRGASIAELFIDVTPGTPPVYRKDALAKLFTVGYDVAGNVMFGTDCCADAYDPGHASGWIRRDSAIYRSLRLPEKTVGAVFGSNLRRFIGHAA